MLYSVLYCTFHHCSPLSLLPQSVSVSVHRRCHSLTNTLMWSQSWRGTAHLRARDSLSRFLILKRMFSCAPLSLLIHSATLNCLYLRSWSRWQSSSAAASSENMTESMSSGLISGCVFVLCSLLLSLCTTVHSEVFVLLQIFKAAFVDCHCLFSVNFNQFSFPSVAVTFLQFVPALSCTVCLFRDNFHCCTASAETATNFYYARKRLPIYGCCHCLSGAEICVGPKAAETQKRGTKYVTKYFVFEICTCTERLNR